MTGFPKAPSSFRLCSLLDYLTKIRLKANTSQRTHLFLSITDMATIKDTIKKLTAERDVTAEQLAKCFQEIMSTEATPAQVGAFLVLLKSHYISPQVLHECSQVLLGYAMRCHVESNEPVLDIVGTGGDSSSIDTFNVSTAAAIVCAAAGLKVAKHGNRSNSGKCGSADFVEALGANIAADCSVAQEALNKTGFSFLFSQKFHPTMKSVAQIRRELGVRTIFNVLGPLVNPVRPAYIVAGVGTKELGPQYAKTLALNTDLKRGIVIHSSLGVDELCTQGETYVWVVENGQIEEKTWSPKDFGLQEHPMEACAGSTAPENAEMFRRILRGEDKGAVLDFLLMNCAAALWLCKKVTSLVEGVDLARKTIEEGTVAALLDQYISITNACSK